MVDKKLELNPIEFYTILTCNLLFTTKVRHPLYIFSGSATVLRLSYSIYEQISRGKKVEFFNNYGMSHMVIRIYQGASPTQGGKQELVDRQAVIQDLVHNQKDIQDLVDRQAITQELVDLSANNFAMHFCLLLQEDMGLSNFHWIKEKSRI